MGRDFYARSSSVQAEVASALDSPLAAEVDTDFGDTRLSAMSRSEKLIIILPAVGDIIPFVYLSVMPLWRTAPRLVVVVCSFAPVLIGSLVILAIMIMRHRKIIRNDSVSLPISIVLAIVGIIEPLFYWI